jgi:hypothetical protein
MTMNNRNPMGHHITKAQLAEYEQRKQLAETNARIDRIEVRLDRIERRLDLVEDAP